MVGNQTAPDLNMHEEHQVPFCRPFVCYDNGTDGNNTVLWDCVPQDCKIYVLIFLGIIVLLAAMTITFNCLILGINLASKTRRIRKRNPTMSNYSIYVVSLAIADLLVGVVVLPLCLVNFYLEFMVNELSYSDSVTKDGYGLKIQSRIPEMSGDIPITTAFVPVEVPSMTHDAAWTVRAFLGVFTHLTLFVSIYTLITASADRLYAANYSAQFSSSQFTKSSLDQSKTSWLREAVRSLKRSTIAVCIVWLLGIVFAILPATLSDELHFRHVGHIFAAMTSDTNYSTSVRWYLSTLMLPLIGIWILNVAICFTLWRRKSQLGLLRKRSLRRNHSSEQKASRNPPSPKMVSISDSVFEPSAMECYVVHKYPASRWNKSGSAEDSEAKPQLTTFHPIYRNKPTDSNDTVPAMKSPTSAHSQSFQWESRSSVLRRKVSSIRRAKEILRKQSYEANITKTLCIVVIAFTIAVLPLIITLGTATLGENSSPGKLNGEVTALTLSLVLLFSNSFVNCVIYGARMRDFRTTLCQLLRTFVDKIKNTFCCCCLDSTDSFSSEVVSGVFLVAKNSRAEGQPRSPRPGGGGTFERFKLFSRASSRKSLNRDATMEKVDNSNKDNSEGVAGIGKTFYPSTTLDLVTKEAKRARPSSSGYRTDPEPPSVQEDGSKKRNSQRSDIGETIKEDQATEETSASFQTANEYLKKTDTPVMLKGEKCDRSPAETSIQKKNSNGDLPMACLTLDNACNNTDFETADEECENPSFHAARDNFLYEDENSQNSELRHSNEFTLGIDFSQFSSL